MERVSLVHTLTLRSLKRLSKEGGCDRIAYLHCRLPEDRLKAISKVGLTQFNSKDAPEAHFRFLREAYDWTERIFQNPIVAEPLGKYISALGLPREHLINALKRAMSFHLDKDCKLVILGEAVFPNAKLRFFTANPALVQLARPDVECLPEEVQIIPAELAAKGLGYAGIILAKILTPAPPATPRDKPEILFDQMYSTLDNPEFTAFYRYFKTRTDVAYNCVDVESPIYKILSRDQKPVDVHVWRVRGFFRRIIEFLRLARVIAYILKDRDLPAPLLYEIIKSFRHKLYYESLIGEYKPKFFLRVRADIEASHPIATAAAEKFGARHVGYSCGAYPFFLYFTAPIDFHYYGVQGDNVRDIFGPAWPGSIRYSTIGPFTAEMEDPRDLIGPEGEPLTLGVFSTTSSDEIWITDSFSRDFYAAAASAAQSAKAKILFKEKYLDDKRLELIGSLCGGKVPYEIIYFEPGRYRVLRAQQVIEESDVVLSMTCSTSAWEALGRKKKLLVYELPWLKHPFEEVEPRLVARTPEELRKAFEWLVGLSQSEYEKIIAPLVARCGKYADGKLVRDFIEGVERRERGRS